MGRTCRECSDKGPLVCEGSEDPTGLGLIVNYLRHSLCSLKGTKMFGKIILSPRTCQASKKYKELHCKYLMAEIEYKNSDLENKL